MWLLRSLFLALLVPSLSGCLTTDLWRNVRKPATPVAVAGYLVPSQELVGEESRRPVIVLRLRQQTGSSGVPLYVRVPLDEEWRAPAPLAASWLEGNSVSQVVHALRLPADSDHPDVLPPTAAVTAHADKIDLRASLKEPASSEGWTFLKASPTDGVLGVYRDLTIVYYDPPEPVLTHQEAWELPQAPGEPAQDKSRFFVVPAWVALDEESRRRRVASTAMKTPVIAALDVVATPLIFVSSAVYIASRIVQYEVGRLRSTRS